MDRRERLYSVISGEKPDRILTGFWHHFSSSDKFGDASVRAHIEYCKAVDPDMLKIMNEHMFYIPESVNRPEDWTRISKLPFEKTSYPGYIEEFKAIKREIPKDLPLLATIHGVLVSAYHATGIPGRFAELDNMVSRHVRENPEAVGKGLRVVAETLIELVEELKKIGCDGIYYCALGDEEDRFTDELYNTYIKPYDRMVLDAIRSEGMISALHICKAKIVLPRYADVDTDIVNWAVHDCRYKLSDGRRILPGKTLLGGFDDRSGVLVDGSREEIEKKAISIIEEAGRENLIVGADCTLPDNVDLWRIKAAQDIVHSL